MKQLCETVRSIAYLVVKLQAVKFNGVDMCGAWFCQIWSHIELTFLQLLINHRQTAIYDGHAFYVASFGIFIKKFEFSHVATQLCDHADLTKPGFHRHPLH